METECVPNLTEGLLLANPQALMLAPGLAECAQLIAIDADRFEHPVDPNDPGIEMTVDDPTIAAVIPAADCFREPGLGVIGLKPGITELSIELPLAAERLEVRLPIRVFEGPTPIDLLPQDTLAVGEMRTFDGIIRNVTHESIREGAQVPNRLIRLRSSEPAILETDVEPLRLRGIRAGNARVSAVVQLPTGEELESPSISIQVVEQGTFVGLAGVRVEIIEGEAAPFRSQIHPGSRVRAHLDARHRSGEYEYVIGLPDAETSWHVSGNLIPVAAEPGVVIAGEVGEGVLTGCARGECLAGTFAVLGPQELLGLRADVAPTAPIDIYTDQMGFNVFCPDVRLFTELDVHPGYEVTASALADWTIVEPTGLLTARAFDSDQSPPVPYQDRDGRPCLYDFGLSIFDPNTGTARIADRLRLEASYLGRSTTFEVALSGQVVVRPR